MAASGTRYGLSEAELERPEESALSGGVERLWQTRRAMAERLQARAEELKPGGTAEAALERLYAEERRTHGEEKAQAQRNERREKLRWERSWLHEEEPVWRRLSGLHADDEAQMSPERRRRCLWKLVQAAERLMRHEMKNEATSAEVLAARTYLWDPVREVCFHLGIAQRRLSSCMKELTGMAVGEMVDRLRAEDLKRQMKEQLRRRVQNWFARRTARVKARLEEERKSSFRDYEIANDMVSAERLAKEQARIAAVPARLPTLRREDIEEAASEIHANVLEGRRGVWFDRGERAMKLGFTSYARLHRGCMLQWGVGPRQVEAAAIEELLAELVTAEERAFAEEDRSAANSQQGEGGEGAKGAEKKEPAPESSP